MGRSRRSGASGLEALRDAFSAANMRALAGVADVGRALLARVSADRGEAVEHDTRDVLVRVVDLMTGHALRARLHVPANMLWRKPRAGETVAVVVPAHANGPAGPVALHGDAGAEGAVPPWYDEKAGLYAPETVRVESSGGDVEVHAPGGHQVKLGAAATKKVNREGDPTSNGTLVFAFNPAGPTLSVTYNPPDGGPPQVLASGSGTITLSGLTGPGSSKVRAED